jgi:hypothetical protein
MPDLKHSHNQRHAFGSVDGFWSIAQEKYFEMFWEKEIGSRINAHVRKMGILSMAIEGEESST